MVIDCKKIRIMEEQQDKFITYLYPEAYESTTRGLYCPSGPTRAFTGDIMNVVDAFEFKEGLWLSKEEARNKYVYKEVNRPWLLYNCNFAGFRWTLEDEHSQ